jgi:hypothetical protein
MKRILIVASMLLAGAARAEYRQIRQTVFGMD